MDCIVWEWIVGSVVGLVDKPSLFGHPPDYCAVQSPPESPLGHVPPRAPTGSPLKSPQNYCAPPTSRVARDHRPLQNNALSRNMTTHMLCKAILDLVEAECTEQSTEEGKQQSRVNEEVDTNHPSCVHHSHLTFVSAASIHVLTL